MDIGVLTASNYQMEQKSNVVCKQKMECDTFVSSLNKCEEQAKDNLMELLSQMKKELGEKIKRGELEEKIETGAGAYSNREWDAILDKFDKVQTEIKKQIEEEIEERNGELSDDEMAELLGNRSVEPLHRSEAKCPYAYLAKDGVITYNGVTFVCDEMRNALYLGDCSDMKNCIRVNLEKGGSLIVNRDNLGELSAAISMFTPEDIRRIMCAIADDKKIQETQQEIDDTTNSIYHLSIKKPLTIAISIKPIR